MSINYHCAGAYGNLLPSESLTAKRDIRVDEFRKDMKKNSASFVANP
jgi:hypothetical protein